MATENIVIINGNEFSFKPGETILEVAQRNSIDIPTLCYLKGATPTGSCRVCVVEVEGARSLVASCTAPAANNMVVRAESPPVIEARRMVLQLLLSSGNHNCAVCGSAGDNWTAFQLKVQQMDNSDELCPVWGDCHLQELAFRYQVTGEKFEATQTR
jgi:NADH dehydrogenase/NADH:ubiquinone oxidoreductase subunit G